MYGGLYFQLMLLAAPLWLLALWRRKGQRQDILATGLLAAIAGPIQGLWYAKDYWHPDYIGGWPWIEDVLFGFFIVGISAAIYEIIFNRHVREIRSKKSHPLIFVFLALFATLGMALFVPWMNSIYAAILSFIIVWLITIFVRPDLFALSIKTALLVTVFITIGYKCLLFLKPDLIEEWWELDNISGILLSGIPLEEFLYFAAIGLAFGPLYELWKGIKIKRV